MHSFFKPRLDGFTEFELPFDYSVAHIIINNRMKFVHPIDRRKPFVKLANILSSKVIKHFSRIEYLYMTVFIHVHGIPYINKIRSHIHDITDTQ